MYRPAESVDWCQCCQWGDSFADFLGSSDFFWNNNSPQIVHPTNNSCCFHISFSFSAAHKAPLCKGGWQKSLISDRGIVLYRCLTIPPSRLTPCHLPLHKGGFGAYNYFTNYAVSICKRPEIILVIPLLYSLSCQRLAADKATTFIVCTIFPSLLSFGFVVMRW